MGSGVRVRTSGSGEVHPPVDASLVVVSAEELDLFKGLFAGVVTGEVRVHA